MITFEGEPLSLQPGQTVLAGLEAAGVEVETSCRAGVCQSCLMQVSEGVPPKRSQAGLSREQVARGLFMPCVCSPEGPLAIARAGDVHQRVEVEVHERLSPGGRMSARLAAATAPGDRLTISGPSGGCCYDGVDPDQPLLLAGAGTGLAPLWGVLHDALAQGHRGPITLYHGALGPAGLYLADELRALQARHANVSYRPCLKDEGDDLLEIVKADLALKTAGLFLCGDAPLVERMRKALFLAGARLADIRADAFAAAA